MIWLLLAFVSLLPAMAIEQVAKLLSVKWSLRVFGLCLLANIACFTAFLLSITHR